MGLGEVGVGGAVRAARALAANNSDSSSVIGLISWSAAGWLESLHAEGVRKGGGCDVKGAACSAL